jgi:D-alanyl-D-alanine carboxypeptidase (penicillin-binding protein 5/6)
MRLIAVVLGAPGSKVRFNDAAALMSWGFENFKTAVVARPGQSFGSVAVRRGERTAIEAISAHGLYLTVPRGSAETLKVSVRLAPGVNAPVSRGQALGWLTASGREAGTVKSRLTARTDVAKASWMGSIFGYVVRFIG